MADMNGVTITGPNMVGREPLDGADRRAGRWRPDYANINGPDRSKCSEAIVRLGGLQCSGHAATP